VHGLLVPRSRNKAGEKYGISMIMHRESRKTSRSTSVELREGVHDHQLSRHSGTSLGSELASRYESDESRVMPREIVMLQFAAESNLSGHVPSLRFAGRGAHDARIGRSLARRENRGYGQSLTFARGVCGAVVCEGLLAESRSPE
jgi:hypothetical protein